MHLIIVADKIGKSSQSSNLASNLYGPTVMTLVVFSSKGCGSIPYGYPKKIDTIS